MPAANTEGMNEHLKEISAQVAPGAHAVLVCDGAGWHQKGKRLRVPDNITLIQLPPYAPELNPVEIVWEYLRANKLCRLVWNSYEERDCPGLRGGVELPDQRSRPHRIPGHTRVGVRQCLGQLV